MKRNLSLDKKRLYKGVEKLAIAVGSTLGPQGRPVLIEDQPGHPKLTKDGVTVAAYLSLSDTEENLGARLVAQAAQATVSAAGDGTTTSTVLAHAIVQAAEKGEVSVDFIKGIEDASKHVVEALEDLKKDLTKDQIYNIAYISANNDAELARLIADAFIETGDDGIVDAQYSAVAKESSLGIKGGSFIQAGMSHQHFITNQKHRTCELKNPVILISNATLHEVGQIEHILGDPIREGRPVVIIADTEKNFTEAFISNVTRGVFKGCIINPGGRVTNDDLRDLADLLKGIYFDNANGNSFDYVSSNYWGEADEVTIGTEVALFAIPSNDHVSDRIEDLREMIETAEHEWQRDQYKARLAMLNGKYATLTIGAPTQAEAMEVKDRVDDAIFAVGSAQKYGFLKGGGYGLLEAAGKVWEETPDEYAETDYGQGWLHFIHSCTSPNDKILENAGLNAPEITPDNSHMGVDARNGELVDLVEHGIIDPAYVTIQAVVNGTSAAIALLSSKASLIIDESD